MKKESKFQAELIKDLKKLYPEAVVLKTDPNYIQGLPDLLILNNNKWAALECKRSSNAHMQPNQYYYISKMSKMSFASFVYPENKEEVLHGLQQAFKP
jgi:hypothetical protein